MAARVEGRLAASDAWDRAYKDSVTAQPWEQVTYLLEEIGPRFTAASLGVSDARTLRRWRDEQAVPRDHDEQARLALLFRIVHAIVGVYGQASVAAGFLRSANPQLDDEAPLVVLAEGNPIEVQKPLLAALRAFLEG
ncbi:MAG TPA: hypothetical protein VGN48_03750 [Pedococcus sp.]|nr:hypothetical protein [Pedococcus sp.]